MLKKLSTGIEASATGESLNSGDPAVHPAASHRALLGGVSRCLERTRYDSTSIIILLVILTFFVPEKITPSKASANSRPTECVPRGRVAETCCRWYCVQALSTDGGTWIVCG